MAGPQDWRLGQIVRVKILSGGDLEGRGGVPAWIRTNQGVGWILTACLGMYLVYLQFSPWVHEKLRDDFTLGFFPVTGVILMMICTLALIFDDHRKERIEELEHMRWKWFFFCLGVLIACGAYFYLIIEIGFLLMSPVFLFVFIFILGLRPWTSCLTSGLVMTILVYGLFRLIGIELPPGILPF